jgi:hypothetical protein
MPVSLPHGTALLLGEPGRLPFLGHFRFRGERGDVRLSAAGRLAARSDAERAFAAARGIEQVLARAEGHDRRAILRDAWGRIAELGASTQAGNDLAIVLVAEDASGVDAAAAGIGAWWGMTTSGATVELALPSAMPSSLAIESATMAVVGAPAGLVLAAPTRDDVAARCGVHA